MKKIQLILFCIIAIFISNFISYSQPQISFPSGTTYDWGNVRPGQSPLSGKFIIKNTGTDTLKITRVQPSCGCTSAPLDKYTLPPNESTELNVTLNISSYEGHTEKYIEITSNDPSSPQKRLTLIANVERLIKVEPGSVVAFMQMKVGQTQTQTVQIKNNSDKDVEISIADYNPKNLNFNLVKTAIIKKGESFPLEITIRAERKELIKGKITIATNNPEFPDLPIFVYGDIQPSPIFIGN
jgi:ribosomal protein S8E